MRLSLISFTFAMLLGIIFGFKSILIVSSLILVFFFFKSYLGISLIVLMTCVISMNSSNALGNKRENRENEEKMQVDDLQMKIIQETYEVISEYERMEINSKKGKNESK